MASRGKAKKPKSARQSIRTAELVNRLQDHVDGKVELNATQVRAAEILLAKRLPNRRAKEAQPRQPNVTLIITDE